MHSKNCIIKNTTMTQSEKDEALKLYEQFELEGFGTNAAEKTFDAIKYRAFKRKKDKLLTIQKTVENILRIEKFASESVGSRYGNAVQSFVSPDLRGVMKTYNLENRSKIYRNNIISEMGEEANVLMKKGLTGGRGKGFLGINSKSSITDQEDFMREASNIANNAPMSTNNPKMRAFAEAYLKVMEKTRKEINALGGNIHKMDGWFVKQTHVSNKISSVDKAAYISEVKELLDKESITSFDTGQSLTDIELIDILGQHWETMKNQGDAPPSLLNRDEVSINAQRQRVFKFKDFDAWKAYNDKYGETDFFNSIVEHADKLGRQKAELQILGPRPQETLNNMIAYAEKAAAKNPGDTKKMLKGLNRAQLFYDIYKRKHNITRNELLASIGTLGRGFATAAMLGRVLLSATVDTAYTYRTAAKMGMWGGKPIVKHFGNIARFILKGMKNEEKQAFLTNAGIIAEDAIFAAQVAQREAGEIGTNQFMEVMGDWVMRFQGLTAWTNGLRHTLAMETMSHFALNRTKSFDQLNAPMQNMLRKYELADQWDTIRNATPEDYRGGKFVTKNSLRNIDPELAVKYQEMLQNVMDDGVVMNSIHATSFAMFGTKLERGTVAKETVSNMMQFKTFPIAIFQRHIYGQLFEDNVNTKMFGMNLSKTAARSYNVISTGLMAWMLGGVSEQIRNLAFGKQPEDMTTAEFWRKALFRSGGLGILEEVIREGFSKRAAINVAGPFGSIVGDTVDLTAVNAYEYATGQDTDFGYELYQFLNKYNVVGNIWYTKQVFDRLIMDRLAELIDPGIKYKVQKKLTRQQKQYGVEYYNKPFGGRKQEIDWDRIMGN